MIVALQLLHFLIIDNVKIKDKHMHHCKERKTEL